MAIARLLPGIAFLLIWQFYVAGTPERQFFFSSPLQVFQIALEELHTREIFEDFGVTTLEVLLGFTIGSFLGTVSGLALSLHPLLARAVDPYLKIIGTIPIIAIAPLTILWFGIGIWSKVALSAIGVSLISITHAYRGAKEAAVQYSVVADSLGVRWRKIPLIVIPGALNWVRSGLHLNISAAITGSFLGEFISSERGLGHYIFKASSLYDTSRVFLGLILISLLALTLHRIIDRWAVLTFEKVNR